MLPLGRILGAPSRLASSMYVMDQEMMSAGAFVSEKVALGNKNSFGAGRAEPPPAITADERRWRHIPDISADLGVVDRRPGDVEGESWVGARYSDPHFERTRVRKYWYCEDQLASHYLSALVQDHDSEARQGSFLSAL